MVAMRIVEHKIAKAMVATRIVEHKIAKDPKVLAIVQQIIDKKYDRKLKAYPHVQTMTKIAMAFCGKEVTLAYQNVAL